MRSKTLVWINDVVTGQVLLTALADIPGVSWGTLRTGIRCQQKQTKYYGQAIQRFLIIILYLLSCCFRQYDPSVLAGCFFRVPFRSEGCGWKFYYSQHGQIARNVNECALSYSNKIKSEKQQHEKIWASSNCWIPEPELEVPILRKQLGGYWAEVAADGWASAGTAASWHWSSWLAAP